MSHLEERLTRLLAEVTDLIGNLEQEHADACAAEAEAERLRQRAQATAAQALMEAQKTDRHRDDRLRRIARDLDEIEKDMSRLRGDRS